MVMPMATPQYKNPWWSEYGIPKPDFSRYVAGIDPIGDDPKIIISKTLPNGVQDFSAMCERNYPKFTRSEMKAFGDHCRVVMNGRYSDQAMDALLDTWIETRKLHIK